MGRYFVGIEVPETIGEDRLVPLTKRLDPLLAVKRWYNPQQFHLTVQFMGELTDAQVEELKRLVTPHAEAHKSFTLSLGELGWFPRAKVVWCGVRGEMEPLQELYGAVSKALAPLGASQFNYDQFRPHITLGRLREVDSKFRPHAVETDDLIGGDVSWTVKGLHLYESVSGGPNGPQYPIRHTFWFGQEH